MAAPSVDQYRLTPNPNVLLELGYAINQHGWDRIVLVLNTATGSFDDLPFDLRGHRPVTYDLREGSRDKADVKKALAGDLRRAIATILAIREDQPEPLVAPSRLAEIRDPRELRRAVLDHFERDQIAVLRGLVADAKERAERLVRSMEAYPVAQLTEALDQLGCVAMVAVRYERRDILNGSLQALLAVYECGFNELGYPWVRVEAQPPLHLWREIVARLSVVGAYATKARSWEAVRAVSLIAPRDVLWREAGVRTTLFRHLAYAEYEALGAIGKQRSGAMCEAYWQSLKATVETLDWAFADLAPTADERSALVARFDCVAYLVAKLEWQHDWLSQPAWPCFVHEGAWATGPVLTELLQDPSARGKLFGEHQDDGRLATALHHARKCGQSEVNTGFGWLDRSVVEFLRHHPELQE